MVKYQVVILIRNIRIRILIFLFLELELQQIPVLFRDLIEEMSTRINR